MSCLPACLSARGYCSVAAAAKSLVRRPAGAIGLLDGIRALSVAWVIAHHALTRMEDLGKPFADPNKPFLRPLGFDDIMLAWYMAPVRIGTAAVDLFFLLSGFLIAFLLGREVRKTGCINIARFLGRRWLRLTPVYALVILLFATYAWRSCLTWGWTNLLFINNFVGPQMFQGVAKHGPNSEQAGCMGHSWSIAVEFQMYLVSPLLVLAMHRLGRLHWLVPVLGTAGSVWLRWTAWTTDNRHDALELSAYNKPFTRVSPYLAGMEVAFLLGPAIDAASARRKALLAPQPPLTAQPAALATAAAESVSMAGPACRPASGGLQARPAHARGRPASPSVAASHTEAEANAELEGRLDSAGGSPLFCATSQCPSSGATDSTMGSEPGLQSAPSRSRAALSPAAPDQLPVSACANSAESTAAERPALPQRVAVPCGALAPACYWLGVAGWITGSFASSGPVLGSLLDPMVFNGAKDADNTAVGVAFALYRPLFGVLTALALFGMLVARLDDDEDKEDASMLEADSLAELKSVGFEMKNSADLRLDVATSCIGRSSSSATGTTLSGATSKVQQREPSHAVDATAELQVGPAELQERGLAVVVRPLRRTRPPAVVGSASAPSADSRIAPRTPASMSTSAREATLLLAWRGHSARASSGSVSTAGSGAGSHSTGRGTDPASPTRRRIRWDPLSRCPACAFGRWPASGRGLGCFLEQWWFVPLARLGYSVYLVHMPIIFGCGALLAVDHEDGETELWVKFMAVCALTLVASMCLSFVIYTLVEKPCNQCREHIWCLRSGPSAPGTVAAPPLQLDPDAALARPCVFTGAPVPAGARKR